MCSRKMTGLSSRIAALSRPFASAGFEGATILMPGDALEPGAVDLRVHGAEAATGADGRADDERHARLLVRHVPVLRRLVDQAVHRQRHEVAEHDLDDRAQPGDGRAERRAGHRELGDRRVEDALLAELSCKPGSGHEDAARRPPRPRRRRRPSGRARSPRRARRGSPCGTRARSLLELRAGACSRDPDRARRARPRPRGPSARRSRASFAPSSSLAQRRGRAAARASGRAGRAPASSRPRRAGRYFPGSDFEWPKWR